MQINEIKYNEEILHNKTMNNLLELMNKNRERPATDWRFQYKQFLEEQERIYSIFNKRF